MINLEERAVQIKPINPHTWRNGFHIKHAVEVSHGQRVLYCSGQTSNDADGASMHPGDYVAQFKLAWKNIVELLTAANMKPSNIARMTFYTTDTDAFVTHAAELSTIWSQAGARPACTLPGVKSLLEANAMIAVDVTAVA
jgi:enamine deaminase RidA (YjgF/YER057c/UK114 family)